MLKFCLNEDGSQEVGENVEISSKHTSQGESKTFPVWIKNDGKRFGVQEAAGTIGLLYSNLKISLEGVPHTLQSSIEASTSTVVLEFESVEGWAIGTIIYANSERMRIESFLGGNTIQVIRNYTADSGQSVINQHNTGSVFKAETNFISLALPSPNNYAEAGTFLAGGASLLKGLNNTYLTQSVDSRDTSTTIKTSSGVRYHKDGIIQINNERMKVTAIDGNNLTVVRGWEGTARSNHSQNDLIYLQGLTKYVDGTDASGESTFKIFVKVQPPAKLPTQKMKSCLLTLVCDESAI